MRISSNLISLEGYHYCSRKSCSIFITWITAKIDNSLKGINLTALLFTFFQWKGIAYISAHIFPHFFLKSLILVKLTPPHTLWYQFWNSWVSQSLHFALNVNWESRCLHWFPNVRAQAMIAAINPDSLYIHFSIKNITT